MAGKQRLTISNVRFLSDLDFTSLDQERNSIPNELIKLETLPRGFSHEGLYNISKANLKEKQVMSCMTCL